MKMETASRNGSAPMDDATEMIKEAGAPVVRKVLPVLGAAALAALLIMRARRKG